MGLLVALGIVLWSSPGMAQIKTVNPEKTRIKRTSAQPATIRANREAMIVAKVSGYLKDLHVDLGDRVSQGDALATIDVPEMAKGVEKQEAQVTLLHRLEEQKAAQVQVARAELAALNSEADRVKRLVTSGAVTERVAQETLSRLDSAKASLQVAEAEVQVAQASTLVAEKSLEESHILMGYATLRAPFDGIISKRSIEQGDLVTNQSGATEAPRALFVLSEMDSFRVALAIPEKEAVWTDVGDPVEITFPALPGRTFTASISRVSSALDPQTRTMEAEIDLDNEQGMLLPGMYAQVVVTIEERDAMVVPAEAIRFDGSGDKSHVYRVNEDKTVSVVPVTLGNDDGHLIEIVSGLNGSETLLLGMLGRLENGQKLPKLSR